MKKEMGRKFKQIKKTSGKTVNEMKNENKEKQIGRQINVGKKYKANEKEGRKEIGKEGSEQQVKSN